MGRIIDRDKNKRRIFPVRQSETGAEVHKIDAYARRIQKAERLNKIMVSIVAFVIAAVLTGVIWHGNL